MRIIKDEDVRVFTDASSDTLTLLSTVRQRDVEKVAEMESKEAVQSLADIGISMADAMKQQVDSTPEELAESRERAARAKKSLAVRRVRLASVVRGMCVGGQNLARDAILEAYDCMDADSGAWVDAQVDTVWGGATPGDAERESQRTDAVMPADTIGPA